jgi:hypothetical protein
MRKDRLYFLTITSIAFIFLASAMIASSFFIKASANQLIEVQIESGKREANEMASLISFQLTNNLNKETVLENIQKTIIKTDVDSWFISVFNWSGLNVCHPDITKVGQNVNSNPDLLSSLKEKNKSDELYDLLVDNSSNSNLDGFTSEVVYITPIKDSDLIIAANVNVNSIKIQMKKLKYNFNMIFLIMGILVIFLSSFIVRIIGSRYEKQLEIKNSSLTSEVINLSKLNTDLFSYKEKIGATSEQHEIDSEKSKKRILTYKRDELVPVLTKDIAYIYTENTITYVVSLDGKQSVSNTSLDDIYSNINVTIFFRANRQFIINIAAIEKVIRYGNKQLKIVLHSDTSEDIIISKNKAAEFKQWLNI